MNYSNYAGITPISGRHALSKMLIWSWYVTKTIQCQTGMNRAHTHCLHFCTSTSRVFLASICLRVYYRPCNEIAVEEHVCPLVSLWLTSSWYVSMSNWHGAWCNKDFLTPKQALKATRNTFMMDSEQNILMVAIGGPTTSELFKPFIGQAACSQVWHGYVIPVLLVYKT